MVTNSLWWATRTVNSKTSDFVRSLTHREHQAMFELLPPQRAALLEQGLLDQAKTAIVVDMPTSGGKTLLAQLRSGGDDGRRYSVGEARRFLKGLGADEWDGVRPEGAALSGTGYKRVWEVLSGEAV